MHSSRGDEGRSNKKGWVSMYADVAVRFHCGDTRLIRHGEARRRRTQEDAKTCRGMTCFWGKEPSPTGQLL